MENIKKTIQTKKHFVSSKANYLLTCNHGFNGIRGCGYNGITKKGKVCDNFWYQHPNFPPLKIKKGNI